ncbi:hypothetical protein J132_02198 [Termitomyces sp. J132]|nr:hypothetical protein H2248_004476 [Termitomyces sp. 'cryptogamus']KNZ81246.1 hypothetical protein J132_02198 [Termitomyces sp. J132]
MTGSAPDDNFAPSILSSTETFWRDHYDFLKAHGYTLRDRYHPDWVPSWEKNPSKKWLHCEDGLYIEHGQVLDATRDDGSLVVLKEIKTNTNKYEIPVSKFFSFGALATHPKNHCVPVIEVIDPPEGSQSAFIVMPYLLNTHHPPFQTIGEVVDFFRQIFEGLEFMHVNNVVHGDCKFNNFMANTLPLFKFPPHPSNLYMRYDYRGPVSRRTSRTMKPVKYYLIDFDLSEICLSEDAPHLRHPPWGGDKSVPEFSLPDMPPCDPFAVDVYCIGNFISGFYLDGGDDLVKPKQGLGFMRELVDDMINSDPKKRPSMSEVVARFETIVKGLDDKTLRSPVVEVGRNLSRFKTFVHWTKQWTRRLRKIPAVPNV